MDIKHIKNLVSLMVENDLSELEVQEGETHILLKRGVTPAAGGAPTLVTATAPATAGPLEPVAALPAGASAPSAGPTQAGPTEQHVVSPMVGTFYAAADPESPPFVKVGDIVDPDSVVCLIEAMKVFNEIKAEVSGRVTKVLVHNAEAVEYEQPLFAVAPV